MASITELSSYRLEKSVLSIEDIKMLLMPVIKKYRIESLSIFGSYARNEARPDSDVDIMIDGGNYHGLFEYMTMIDEIKAALGRDVDVVTKSTLENCRNESDKQFKQNIEKEMILLV